MQSVLITGTSKGIGYETALAFTTPGIECMRRCAIHPRRPCTRMSPLSSET